MRQSGPVVRCSVWLGVRPVNGGGENATMSRRTAIAKTQSANLNTPADSARKTASHTTVADLPAGLILGVFMERCGAHQTVLWGQPHKQKTNHPALRKP